MDESERHYQSRLLAAKSRYDNHLRLLSDQLSEANIAAEKKWLDKRAKYESRLKRYTIVFTRRMAKFDKRMEILAKRKEIVKNWRSRSRLVFRKPSGSLPDHPYSREQILTMPGYGDFTIGIGQVDPWPFVYRPKSDFAGLFADDPVFQSMPDGPYYILMNDWYYYNLIETQYESAISNALSGFRSEVNLACASEIATLESKVLRKLAKKIRDGDLHVGNIIAERAQTFRMFGDVISRLSSLASGKTKLISSLTHFLRNPRMIADDFLAFKFGVEPLLNDAYNLGVKLAQIETSDTSEPIAFRANSRLYFSKTIEGPFGNNYDIAGEIIISYVVKYTIPNSTARYLSSVGLVNPSEIAWELLPWSFVVDWMLPVSDWMQTLSNDIGLQFLTGTRKVHFRHTCSQFEVDYPGFRLHPLRRASEGWGFVSGHFIRDSKVRTVLTELPAIPAPIMKDPISSTHIFEAIALSVQRLFRR